MDKYILSEVCYQNGYKDGYEAAKRWLDPKINPPSDKFGDILLKSHFGDYEINTPVFVRLHPDYCTGWRPIE